MCSRASVGRFFTRAARTLFTLRAMDAPFMPPLPAGYSWVVKDLADGRGVLEVWFQGRDIVVHAFQPKRRKCWYLGNDGFGYLESRGVWRAQCQTLSEV